MDIFYSPLVYLFVILVLIAAIVMLIIYNKRQQEHTKAIEQRYRDLEKKVDGFQLKNLEAKLQPHLFKNILNSVQSHAYQTYYTLDKLATVLDYVLYEARDEFVSVRREIDFAKSLIDINKIKVSPLFEIKVKTKIATQNPYYEQKLIVPMVCLDLIENAFKHSDLQSADAFISFYFELSEDGIFGITVSNTSSELKPLTKQAGGLGMEAFEQRLRILYKDCFKLERFMEGNIYTAYLKLDLKQIERAKMYNT
ncbi:sensor histidine kinase [Sphingobacterium spiritivorum]|uniref:sensor histidine kinase n=1 Tax=Sphingobacterium TaxID=28453 RepID=UPI0025D364C8|nr:MULTISPECIES: histidine kinase [unclassified Sphingobacterium]